MLALNRYCLILIPLLVIGTTGCGLLRRSPVDLTAGIPVDNPLFVPAMDREFLWNQTVDAVDDYFRIEREERIRLIGGVLTEGRIDTFPTIGSTIFEPWRRDSTAGYEKLHATFQSVRRRGTVRVIPTEGGYLVEVEVAKELEDLDKPEHATAGGATQRHDGSLVRQEGAAGRYSVVLGWIPLGRDVSLEQQILSDLRARLDIQNDISRLPASEMIEEIPPGWRPSTGSNLPDDSPVESLPQPLRRVPDPE